MALKLIIKKEEFDALEEGIQVLYSEKTDGNFHLAVEGAVDKGKLDEFRVNNVKLAKELADIQKKFKDIDPEKHAELQARIQEIEDSKMIDAGKIDELVAQKVDRMKADFEGQTTALKTAVETHEQRATLAETRLAEVLIDSEITKAINATGKAKPGAISDIIVRGKGVWKLIDGKPTPMEGEHVLYGKDGKSSLTFEEWATGLQAEAPHLFEESEGGGSKGSGNKERSFGPGVALERLKKLPPSERLKELHRAGAPGK